LVCYGSLNIGDHARNYSACLQCDFEELHKTMSAPTITLAGRVAVVLGGTAGIGRGMSLSFAEAGADVVASGRRQEIR
jgi:hypothetical protein